ELAIPLYVGAQAHGAAEGDDLEDAAQRIPGLLGAVDGLDHRALRRGICAAHLGFLGAAADLIPGDLECADVHAADLRDAAQYADAELAEQALGDAGDRDARGGFPRARALEHVADVTVPVLHSARQVGVAGTRPRDGLGRGARGRLAHG